VEREGNKTKVDIHGS